MRSTESGSAQSDSELGNWKLRTYFPALALHATLIYELATRRMLFRDFQVEIVGEPQSTRATGEAVDTQRHAPAVEPNGATMTDLVVAQRAGGWWVAQSVIDI
ncbi:MAG: archease [Rhodobacter sp.]|nr:archease [Rhodobacter sp.]